MSETGAPHKRKSRLAIGEGPGTRFVLIAVALAFPGVMLIAPLLVVFVEAFGRGLGVYFQALALPDTMHALQLTLIVAAIAVPANLVFGVAAAWLIAKYDFKGKSFLLTLIDLPFAVSPVVSGLIFVLLFGANSALGPWLADNNIKILYAVPGIVIASLFAPKVPETVVRVLLATVLAVVGIKLLTA